MRLLAHDAAAAAFDDALHVVLHPGPGIDDAWAKLDFAVEVLVARALEPGRAEVGVGVEVADGVREQFSRRVGALVDAFRSAHAAREHGPVGGRELRDLRVRVAAEPSGDRELLAGAEDVDLEDIRAATSTDTDQASAAEARLLEAFPGTSEVGT